MRVLGITQSEKDGFYKQFHAITREAAMSVFLHFELSSVAHEPLKTFFAMIENFLGFHLARKSITLLFTNKARHQSTAQERTRHSIGGKVSK